MNRPRMVAWLTLTLAFAAFVQGSYIHAKAEVAQLLLRAAWSRSITSGVAQKPWPWADMRVAGRILVPDSDVDMIVLGSGSGEAMAFGPALLTNVSGSEKGPSVLGGHRDTHLRFLADMEIGQDLVYSSLNGRTTRYRLENTLVADSRSERVQVGVSEDALILVTCYPFDTLLVGGPLRFVAIARPVEESNLPPSPPKLIRTGQDRGVTFI